MAYTTSVLVNGQASLTSAFASSAMKSTRPETFLAIQQMSSIMIPTLTSLRTREDRTVDAFTPARSSRTLSTGRSHNHTGTVGSSLQVTPSLTTYSDPFAISIKQADNNVLSYQEMFNAELINSFKNFMEGLESEAISFLADNRSQVNNGNSNQGTFNGTNNVYEITESTISGYTPTQIVNTIMDENNLDMNGGIYYIFCDSLAYDKFNYQMNQGSGNAYNTSFQMDNLIFVRSKGMASEFTSIDATYTNGVWCAVPMGSIAYLDWIPRQNREGYESKVQSYGSIVSPLEDGNLYAIHSYHEAEDATSTGGYTQDDTTQFEISQDGGFVVSPCTTANETPIQAFALV